MYISDNMQTTLIHLRRFLKKIADDQCSSITKAVSTISNICPYVLFNMGVDWSEIGLFMEVSIMLNICTYCVFTLYGRNLLDILFQLKSIQS